MAATKRCPYCKEEVLADARKCRYCHSKLKRQATKTELVASGILLLAGIYFCSYQGPAPTPKAPDAADLIANSANSPASTPASPPRPAGPRPVFKTTARELYALYDRNEVAADQKIGHAIIEITGIVRSIDKDIFNHPTISLFAAPDDGWTTVQLILKTQEANKAAQLSKYQKLVVRCDSVGRIVTSPVGDDCVILKALGIQDFPDQPAINAFTVDN